MSPPAHGIRHARQVLFYAHWDITAPARHAQEAFADAAAGNVRTGAVALEIGASFRYAAVDCDSVDKGACRDLTSGGSVLPAVRCFANGNWTEGPPLRLSYETEMAAPAAATLSSAGILEFGARCVAAWDGHSDQIRTSRYVSSRAVEAEASRPPPFAPRRSLDHDRPASAIGKIRDNTDTAAPKKAVEMEYVPHVSDNQGGLVRRFRRGGDDDRERQLREGGGGGGGGGASLGTTQQTKKLKRPGSKSSPVILEGSEPRKKAAKGGATEAMRRVGESIQETAEERRCAPMGPSFTSPSLTHARTLIVNLLVSPLPSLLPAQRVLNC